MGRHPDPLSSYRVSIHKIGKYLYASTQPIRFNEEKGKNEHYRIHWGTVSKVRYPRQSRGLESREPLKAA